MDQNLLTDINLLKSDVKILFLQIKVEAIKFAHLHDYKPVKGSFDWH